MKLEGRVLKIQYCDPNSGWTSFALMPLSGDLDSGSEYVYIEDNTVKCVGNFPGVNLVSGLELELEGSYKRHEKFGLQFETKSWFIKQYRDESTFVAYISSVLNCLSTKQAKKIYVEFGQQSLDILETSPEKIKHLLDLDENFYVSMLTQLEKAKTYKNYKEYFLLGGFDEFQILRGVRKYGVKNLISTFNINPYRTVTDRVYSISQIDSFCDRKNIINTGLRRSEAVIESFFDLGVRNSGSYLVKKDDVSKKIDQFCDNNKIRRIDSSAIEKLLPDLIYRKILNEKEGHFLHKNWFELENNVVSNLKRIYNSKNCSLDLSGLDEFIERFEVQNKIVLTLDQKEVLRSLNEKILLVSGPAGSGKTTLIKALLEFLNENKFTNTVLSPTGKATQRVQEITNQPAYTIHRYLKADMDSGWGYNSENNIDFIDLLIVDESTFIDAELSFNILSALVSDMRLIFIGDPNQLPSVGPGKFFKDMIDSEKFKHIKLSKVIRQKESSGILVVANSILDNVPFEHNTGEPQFRFFQLGNNVEDITNAIIETAKSLHSKNKDFQVICPQNIGELGTIKFNYMLRDVLNPDTSKYKFDVLNNNFRINDTVIINQNNYKLDVYNGDIGTISHIDLKAKQCRVQLDSKEVTFKFREAGEYLSLAYALSVHKTQGSEFDIVLIPCCDINTNMLTKNLIYTAITRAKNYCFVYGDFVTFVKGSAKIGSDRKNLLKNLLIESI